MNLAIGTISEYDMVTWKKSPQGDPLSSRVKNKIKSGWHPYGGLIVTGEEVIQPLAKGDILKKISDYNVLVEKFYPRGENLVMQVNNAIKKGWQPLGYTCVVPDLGKFQAVVKYEA